MGICEVLIPLTSSPSVEVQGNSAAALGNLSSKGGCTRLICLLTTAAEDYAPFNAVWNKPDGGLHAYLVRFLSSADTTFQHIAVWVSYPLPTSLTLRLLSSCLRQRTPSSRATSVTRLSSCPLFGSSPRRRLRRSTLAPVEATTRMTTLTRMACSRTARARSMALPSASWSSSTRATALAEGVTHITAERRAVGNTPRTTRRFGPACTRRCAVSNGKATYSGDGVLISHDGCSHSRLRH